MSGREDVWRRVRALLERANHPGTPQAEAESALALAYRLMVKYELDERELTETADGATGSSSDKVVSRTYETTGPYRVRRNALRFAIADALSCACFRDFTAGDVDTVVGVVYGTEADLDALEVIYGAAEMLALRTIPWGDRSFRTSWFHGFTDGVWSKLMRERKKMVRSNKAAAIVLRDRLERAVCVMEEQEPGLRRARDASATWADAYEDGRQAGSRLTTGRRDVGGRMGALPRGG